MARVPLNEVARQWRGPEDHQAFVDFARKLMADNGWGPAAWDLLERVVGADELRLFDLDQKAA